MPLLVKSDATISVYAWYTFHIFKNIIGCLTLFQPIHPGHPPMGPSSSTCPCQQRRAAKEENGLDLERILGRWHAWPGNGEEVGGHRQVGAESKGPAQMGDFRVEVDGDLMFHGA